MLADIRSGKVNCVIVKDLSRFGRNYLEAGRYIEKIFPCLGVRFIAIYDGVDTAFFKSGFEEMIIPFKNLINDAYSRDISIKIRSHLDIKRKNGAYIGSFAPYGYRKSPANKNQLIIDETAASVIQKIFQWKIKGSSSSKISDRLNQLAIPTPMEYKRRNGENFWCGFCRKTIPRWQVNEVNDILKNEVYTGVLLQGKTSSLNYKIRKREKREKKDWFRCENSHEGIISKEDFALVQTLLKQDTRVVPEKQILHLFSGFVKCGYCDGTMTRKTIPVHGKKYIYLVCIENKNRTGCTNHREISLEKFERTILQVINLQMKKSIDKVLKPVSLRKKVPETMREKELEFKKKWDYVSDLFQDYQEGMLSEEEYLELKNYYQEDRMILNNMPEVLRTEDKNEKQLKFGITGWEVTKLSRELLLRLIREIKIYDKNRIEIVFQFQSE